MSVDRHEIHEQSIGAYLLGALDESEVTAFEHHLDECPVCRDEVERLRPPVEALPRSVAQLRPSPELKTSLMAAIAAEPDAPPVRAPKPSFFERFRLAPGPRLAWVATALIAVVVGAGAFALGRSDSDGGPPTRVLTQKLEGMPGATASVTIPGGQEAATLRVHGMPTLPDGRTYQAWVQRGDEMIPKSLFNVGADGNGATAVDGDVAGADAVLVTREPASGSRSPTGTPLLRINL